ncbi:tissue factor pathway inhibitor 2-like [Condylostylus longicornis]|uniref:tissue factor pathway inhibitor 2-like n=1 Tax=Condylostylus longicornis TaxID=2530218 RepID=UPI00244E1C6E|nr:tissue factor pathway inhibitor 2-like [Condylostylus longicornis]
MQKNSSCADKPACFLQPDTGPCYGAFTRYYFNPCTGQCELFSYGGCGGNANNFKTLEDCQKEYKCICFLKPDTGPCDGAFTRYYFNSCTCQCERFSYGGCGDKSICFLKPDTGPCKALFFRYYFNPCTCQCESFYYGGCEGNANNFQTLDECQNKCMK